MRTYIKVDERLRSDLMGIFGLSRMSVWKALNGLTASEKSTQVRRYALANGGQYVREEFVPSCKTIHNEDGGFRQEFAGGVSVQVNPSLNTITITRDDEELECFKDVTLNTWGNVLRMAQAYSEGCTEVIAN